MIKKKLTVKEKLMVASMLFGMFFGAGNLIFPIHMGQLAGRNLTAALIGFIVTGVGLPVLGVAALGISRSGGLNEMAIMSALGAECTLPDISDRLIESDRLVGRRENYSITLIKGDMTERFPFEDCIFDYVINPVSNQYIKKVEPVFAEIARVLKPGGTFLAGLDTGIYWAFWGENERELCNRLPFNPLKDEKLRAALMEEDMSYIFSHTLEEQIGGQLKAGRSSITTSRPLS